jgi:hypothetical protein
LDKIKPTGRTTMISYRFLAALPVHNFQGLKIDALKNQIVNIQVIFIDLLHKSNLTTS